MGGDHAPVDGHKKPHVTIKAPWYEPLLANKSKLCPPDFHYNRGMGQMTAVDCQHGVYRPGVSFDIVHMD